MSYDSNGHSLVRTHLHLILDALDSSIAWWDVLIEWSNGVAMEAWTFNHSDTGLMLHVALRRWQSDLSIQREQSLIHRTTCVRVIQLLESDLLEHDDADLRELGHIHATLMDEERRSGRLHGRPTGGLVPLTIRSQDPTNWLHHPVSIQPSSNWNEWASIWANRADDISEILRATNPADPGFIDVIGIQSFMFRLKNVCCEQDKLTKLEAILTDSSLFEPFNESTSLFGLELESLREKMLSCPTYPLRCDRELEEE